MNNPFDYFDKIVCICGQHEPERWMQVQKEFDRIGVLDRVERFDEVINSNWLAENFGKTSEWSKTDYCHWKIISDAHEQNLKNVFIFESDIHFIDTDLEKMSKSIESLNNVDWKLFYMGGIPHNVFGVENEHLVNVSMCQAHAYAINGSACKEVADKLLQGMIAIDQVYKREKQFGLGRYAYATHPRFVVQEDENIQTRKQYSNIMWEKVVVPIVDMHIKKVKIIVGSRSVDGKNHRIITSNCKTSLDNTGILASNGMVEIYELKLDTEYEKMEIIKKELDKGNVCFYFDSANIFLKESLGDLIGLLNDYDLIIQPSSIKQDNLIFFKEILNLGFCCVKPTDFTKKLFDSTEECDILYESTHSTESRYFNSKINSAYYYENIKTKILCRNEFTTFKNFNSTDHKPTVVNYTLDFKENVHPRTILRHIKESGHYFLDDNDVSENKNNIFTYTANLENKTEFATFSFMHPGREGQHKMILENFKLSIDKSNVFDVNKITEKNNKVFKTNFEKLELICEILNEGRECLYCDPDIVFLKNPLTKLKEYLNDYDLVIQSNVTENSELKYFHKILNPGFCFVKSTELTKELFDTSQEIELLYEGVRPDEVYFNSKLNTVKFKDLKVKILNEDEFCISFKNEEKLKKNEPYLVHYNELPSRILHPKNKIARMKDYGNWFL